MVDLPDPDPTPPGIPATNIDEGEYHSLFEYEELEETYDTDDSRSGRRRGRRGSDATDPAATRDSEGQTED